MKVKSFRAPTAFMAGVAQGRTIIRRAGACARRNWIWICLTAAAAIVAALLLFPHDSAFLAQLHASPFSRQNSTMRLAAFLGTWGDYPTYNLPLAVAIWLYGSWSKSRSWRRIAITCFLGATFAGLFDDCFRLTLGRPRPEADMPDGFYGLNDAWHSRFQSFPSGHAAAVFGTAIALLFTCRWLGWLATIYALAVVWARMELYRHYPSDVMVGTLIGIVCGCLIGRGATSLRVSRHTPSPPS